VLSFRPKTRHPSIKGLYFVGASTHPGTGVPICLAGAKIVANQILTDQGMESPWKEGGLLIEGNGKGIDAVQSRLVLSTLYWILLLIIGLVLALFIYAGGNVSGLKLTLGDW
jgi:phytoene desaturase (3,4-didehydrolycopene-forming)